jgi:hypothetical protein
MNTKSKHSVHKLKRKIYKTGVRVYFCTRPDCHYKIECDMALGKVAMCNLCGNEFEMTMKSIRLDRPHCPDCSKVKVKGQDGKSYYVRKLSSSSEALHEISSAMADDNVKNLRDKLNSIVGITNDVVDEEDFVRDEDI